MGGHRKRTVKGVARVAGMGESPSADTFRPQCAQRWSSRRPRSDTAGSSVGNSDITTTVRRDRQNTVVVRVVAGRSQMSLGA